MGQELTARTHFQGLIRKRLMPVILTPLGTEAHASLPFVQAANIENDPWPSIFGQFEGLLDPAFTAELPSPGTKVLMGKKNVGKLLSSRLNVAIAQLRLAAVREPSEPLTVDNYSVTPLLPRWWPADALTHKE
jgi:folate-binding Fe-S cluster repair protein YgfZ